MSMSTNITISYGQNKVEMVVYTRQPAYAVGLRDICVQVTWEGEQAVEKAVQMQPYLSFAQNMMVNCILLERGGASEIESDDLKLTVELFD